MLGGEAPQVPQRDPGAAAQHLVQMGQRAVQQLIPAEADQVQLRTPCGRSPRDGHPPAPVNGGGTRLVQLIVHSQEPVVDQRHLIGRDHMVLDGAEPRDRADGPRHVVGEGVRASRGIGDDLRLPVGGQAAHRRRIQPAQITTDQLVSPSPSGDRG